LRREHQPAGELTLGIIAAVTLHAVFFDAGETLVHPAPSFPELFAAIVTREGHPRDTEQIVDGLAIVSDEFARAAGENELWTTSPDRSRRFWLGVYDRFLDVLEIPSTNGLPETLYREFTTLQNYTAFDDVRPTLERLREQGYLLGVISNFEPWLEDLLVHLSLADLLPMRVISGIEGMEKPDPSIFLLALERSGLSAHEVAYVGDLPEFDVVPSAAVGMFPVLIDRRGRHPDHEGTRVTDLAHLPEVLRG
jgi:putative hydrolase of the HAD superfamily